MRFGYQTTTIPRFLEYNARLVSNLGLHVVPREAFYEAIEEAVRDLHQVAVDDCNPILPPGRNSNKDSTKENDRASKHYYKKGLIL
eukprot:scaffold3378_cov104-Cylindrotheca_fusiformis.AAC.2